MTCGCDSCAKCCKVTGTFWVFMLLIGGIFLALWLLFWRAPDRLACYRGPLDCCYIYRIGKKDSCTKDQYTKSYNNNGDDLELQIFRCDTVVAIIPIGGGDGEISQQDADDLVASNVNGKNLLWFLLIVGLAATLALLFWIKANPDKFVCCNLREKMKTMEAQYTSTTTVVEQPYVETVTTKSTTITPTGPSATATETTTTKAP